MTLLLAWLSSHTGESYSGLFYICMFFLDCGILDIFANRMKSK